MVEEGILGVAPKATLIPIRVAAHLGYIDHGRLAEGIKKAADELVKVRVTGGVIYVAFGSKVSSPELELA